jgi:PAS domain S-box-containing protein
MEPHVTESSRTPGELLRLTFEASPAAMFMVDGEGVIELANRQCEIMFGYAPGEMGGLSVERLVPLGVRGRHRKLRDDFGAAPSKRLMGAGRDLRAMRRDGSEFPVEIGLTPVATPQGLSVVVFAIDISARLESEARLKNSLAELERANESLSRFAYVASHDIQEPLRKISAFGNILRAAMEDGNQEEARYAADVMTASAQRARALVADLLSLARSLNNAYELEPISIRDTIGVVLDALSQAIQEKSAQIACLGEDFVVRGDRAQTLQMLQNLVSNALKYHKPGEAPRVKIRLETDEAEHRLKVEDEGIGFAAGHGEEIFEPFRRLHNRDDIPGSGIGLAICKTTASRHGWRLSAASTPTVGSTFEIVFPGDGPGARQTP